ncbi:MAG: hypothetical protein ACLTAX_11365 [Waltera sp.]
MGIRPHYIVYDKATASFYVWSSMTGTMYVYRRDQKTNQLKLSKAVRIKETGWLLYQILYDRGRNDLFSLRCQECNICSE